MLYMCLAMMAFLASCQKESNTSEQAENNSSVEAVVQLTGNIVALNDVIGITEGAYGGGKYSFPLVGNEFYNGNTILSVRSKYSAIDGAVASDSVPTIQFTVKGTHKYQKDSTIVYTIGSKDEFEIQNWRLPSLPTSLTDIKVNISIPSDKQLFISTFKEEYYNTTMTSKSRVRVNAHGSPMTGRFNTVEGFQKASMAGYPCCVAVPKRTKDGVWVCFHDDDNINGLRYPNAKYWVCNRKIENGDTIYIQFDEKGKVVGNSAMPVEQLTWDFLKDKIVFNNAYYYIWGEQYVPKLEDFFDVCLKTGMIPMLSVHPALTASEWGEIKVLAQKYGVLNKLDVKLRPGGDYVNPAIQVLGNEIGRYSIYVYSAEGCHWSLNKLNSLREVGQETPAIEMLYSIATKNLAGEIVNNGYSCSVFDGTRTLTSERMKEMMSWGVTEFTSNYNHSYGLNW